MKTFKFLRNAAGMGLVEVMMAVAVTGGLTLTIAKLMENAGQSAKQVEAKSENTNLKGIIQDVLNNPTACNNTFNAVMNAANVAALTAGAPTASVTVPDIKDKLNAIKYSTASTNISPLTITSLQVTNYNSGAFTGDLIVNSTFRKSSTIVMMVKPIRIPINFSFNGANLTACSTMAVGGEWLLGGNAGTVDGTDYIGTSDDKPLNFRVNAQRAGRVDTVGQTFVGYQAGLNQAVSNDGTAFGFQASKSNTTGLNNSSFGWVALTSNTTGSENSAFGNRALTANTTGHSNAAFGASTLTYNTIGAGNSAFGWGSLFTNTTGNYNTAVGVSSLMNNTIGANNTGVGINSLYTNTTGNAHTALGSNSMRLQSAGMSNTAIGAGAMETSVSSQFNTCVGVSCMYKLSTGTMNIAMGVGAMNGNATGLAGSYNVGIGNYTGMDLSSGANNVLIGHNAAGSGSLTTGSNNIFIGSGAGLLTGNVSNTLYIDGASTAVPLIGGDFTFTSTGRFVKVNGLLDIDGRNNVAFKMPTGYAIRTKTAAVSDKVYFDTRTLFRDGASGGSGFVGIAGGLGIGSGSWWDGSVVPPQGSVIIEGNVGIGTQSPSQKLHVVGNILASGTITPSDRRLKENIKPLESSLKKLSQINGVSYQKKDRKLDAEKEIGVIAQDVKAVYPDLVSTFTHTDGKKYSAVNYVGLIAPVIEAIKELYGKFLLLVKSDEKQNLEIKNLKAENEKLILQMKQQQDSFEARMKKLEADVAQQKAQKK